MLEKAFITAKMQNIPSPVLNTNTVLRMWLDLKVKLIQKEASKKNQSFDRVLAALRCHSVTLGQKLEKYVYSEVSSRILDL